MNRMDWLTGFQINHVAMYVPAMHGLIDSFENNELWTWSFRVQAIKSIQNKVKSRLVSNLQLKRHETFSIFVGLESNDGNVSQTEAFEQSQKSLLESKSSS